MDITYEQGSIDNQSIIKNLCESFNLSLPMTDEASEIGKHLEKSQDIVLVSGDQLQITEIDPVRISEETVIDSEFSFPLLRQRNDCRLPFLWIRKSLMCLQY